MGPVPGILLGIIALVINSSKGNPIIHQVAVTAIFINGFNLLPVFPLDGGRFFDDILFTRNPYIEIIFKIIAVIILILLAIDSQSFVLGIFTLFIILGLQMTYLVAKLSKKIKKEVIQNRIEYSEEISDDFLQLSMPILEKELKPEWKKSKTQATIIVQLWNKIFSKPPSGGATFGLLTLYIFIILVTFIAFSFSYGTSSLPAPWGNFTWTDEVSEEGRYSVKMPGMALRDTLDDNQDQYPMKYLSVQFKDALFITSHYDISDIYTGIGNRKKFIKEKHDLIEQNRNSIRINEIIKTKNGRIELLSESKNSDGSRTYTKMMMVDFRIFILSVQVKKETINKADIETFFNSFLLLDKSASSECIKSHCSNGPG